MLRPNLFQKQSFDKGTFSSVNYYVTDTRFLKQHSEALIHPISLILITIIKLLRKSKMAMASQCTGVRLP